MKRKLTLSISEDVIVKAKERANELGVPLSRVVERALKFWADPRVHCFLCGKQFNLRDAELCPRCGWFKCPHCGGCGCKLSDEARRVAFHMRRTLQEIFGAL